MNPAKPHNGLVARGFHRVGAEMARLVLLVGAALASANVNAAEPAIDSTRLLDGFRGPSRGFIENRGQWDASVKFAMQGAGGAVWLARDAILVDRLATRAPAPPLPRRGAGSLDAPDAASARERGVVLRVRFVGANPALLVAGEGALSTRYNYFLGADPSRWQSNVRGYASVRYDNIYPGIDLVYRMSGDRLKYDVIVEPGADASLFALEYEGAEGVRVAADGTLRIDTAIGTFVEEAPRIYQESSAGRVEVAGEYRALGAARAGYTVGAYDRRLPLVIDPSLSWSTFLGGSQADVGSAIALDANGKALVVGSTLSQEFPTTVGVYDRIFNGNYDVFITKVSALGRMLAFSTFLGASKADFASAAVLAVDEKIVVTGATASESFPTTPGAIDRTYNGGASDGFVAVLTSQGEALVYSTLLGGSSDDNVTGVTLAGLDNAVVAGWTGSPNFPATFGAFDTSHNGGSDAFVSRLNAAGSAFVYSTFLGGADEDLANAVASSGQGAALVVGNTSSNGFPTSASAFDRTWNGALDGFAASFDIATGAFLSASYLGGATNDYANAVIADAQGNAIIAGETESEDFPTTAGAYARFFSGFSDAFITKFSRTNDALLFSTYLGGRQLDGAFAVALDTQRRVVVAGYTASGDFPITEGYIGQTNNRGVTDAFVSQLSETASTLVYSTYLGGIQPDLVLALAVGEVERAHVTGYTASPNFPVTEMAFDSTYSGGSIDAFVTRLALLGVEPPGKTESSSPSAAARPQAVRVASPATASIAIDFALPAPSRVVVTLFDVGGRRLHQQDLATVPAGESRAAIEPRGAAAVAPGVYWLRVDVNGESQTHRVVVIR
ncbi:MAG: hypothetical protein ACKVU1_04730 [bacterium]